MRKIKSFLIVFTALILVCALPIQSFALDCFDIQYFSYGITDSSQYVPANTAVWYNCTIYNQKITGKIHCRGGHVYKCFILFIPFLGYYVVTIQDGDLPIDFVQNNRNCIYRAYVNGSRIEQSYYSYSGDGFLTSSNTSCFQTVLFGRYWTFCMIAGDASGSPDHSMRSSIPYEGNLTDSENQQLQNYINNNKGNDKPIPSSSTDAVVMGGSTVPTNANGEPVPTDSFGNPVPTDKNGNPVPTNEAGLPVATDKNGNPVTTNSVGNAVPTLPGGRAAETFPNGEPVPTGSDGKPLVYVIMPDGTIYIIPEGYELVTDPDTSQPITDPDTHEPIYREVTILNEFYQQSKVNYQFDKINNLVSDIDDVSSLMASNQAILSAHIDSTRGLVDDVLSWFPAPVIACIVCGAIMIIAVKITGSGNSA